MGHYASEIYDNYGKDSAEIHARREAGFQWVSGDRLYDCPRCHALVVGDRWREHAAYHDDQSLAAARRVCPQCGRVAVDPYSSMSVCDDCRAVARARLSNGTEVD
jgi:ribosomal protein S27AE